MTDASGSGGGHFNFTTAMERLCEDVCHRLTEFVHIDMSRVAVAFAQTRRRMLHGMQAKLTPLRFTGGTLTTRRRNREWTLQRVFRGDREMLYILTFYLPRFLDQTFREKMITVLHELYHISPRFDGDIRRMSGRYHVHSHSQEAYDRLMDEFVDQYLSLNPPQDRLDFLKQSFSALSARHGRIIGQRVPIPRMIPLSDARTA
jgi:energy-converting hydrogenase A subunit M